MRWFPGAPLPGFLSLMIVPWMIFRSFKPEITDTAPAQELARDELDRMGPFKREEKWLMAIMLTVMAGWISSPWHGISNTFVALAGLSAHLNAGITHYGTGSAPVYFGAGYVRQGDWWRIGFLISVMNLVIWMGVGIWWWKLIGLW